MLARLQRLPGRHTRPPFHCHAASLPVVPSLDGGRRTLRDVAASAAAASNRTSRQGEGNGGSTADRSGREDRRASTSGRSGGGRGRGRGRSSGRGAGRGGGRGGGAQKQRQQQQQQQQHGAADANLPRPPAGKPTGSWRLFNLKILAEDDPGKVWGAGDTNPWQGGLTAALRQASARQAVQQSLRRLCTSCSEIAVAAARFCSGARLGRSCRHASSSPGCDDAPQRRRTTCRCTSSCGRPPRSAWAAPGSCARAQ
jgi:hypothetical protein